MKLKELIKNLKDIEKQHGDKNIYISSDPEGNEFHDFAKGLEYSVEFKGNSCILYPNTYIEYDEIK